MLLQPHVLHSTGHSPCQKCCCTLSPAVQNAGPTSAHAGGSPAPSHVLVVVVVVVYVEVVVVVVGVVVVVVAVVLVVK